MRIIIERNELRELAKELKVRDDWHEPDEQGLTAEVYGTTFDNAGFWPGVYEAYEDLTEKHVVISQDGEEIAAVNLATLLAWASEE